jgi:hypothetical protein
MKYSLISRKEIPFLLTHISTSIVSVLVLTFVAYGPVHAQGNPIDSPPIGHSAAGQYKSGETPKKEDGKKKSVRSNDKQKDKANGKGEPNIIERDPRHPHEGSGPDPFGRY